VKNKRVDTLLQIINIEYMKKLIIFLIPIKRFFYFISRAYLVFKNGLVWLFTSKEHTNFTFLLNNQQVENISFVISKFYDLDEEFIKKEVNNLQKINIGRDKGIKNYRVVDVDYKPKWDYRLISYFLILDKKISSVYEFGVDQGRLGYLISKLISNNDIEDNFKYVGVEYNPRKGVMVENNSSKQIQIIFDRLEDTLSKFSFADLSNSLIISSTHEEKSEKFLFDYLDYNKIYPKYLISDETSNNSSYIKFVSKNHYTHTILPIEDSNNFLDTMYIGIAKI